MQNIKKDRSEILNRLLQKMGSRESVFHLDSEVKKEEDKECDTCAHLWYQICLARSNNDINAEKRYIRMLEHH